MTNNVCCGSIIRKCKCIVELLVIKYDLFKGNSPIKSLKKTEYSIFGIGGVGSLLGC